MKTKFTLLAAFILLIFYQYALAFTPSDDEVNSWMGTPVAGFMENKGQLCDMNYNPAPYLLFKLEDRGTDVYITDRGLSYVFSSLKRNRKTLRQEIVIILNYPMINEFYPVKYEKIKKEFDEAISQNEFQ